MKRSNVDINKVSPMMKEYLKTKSEYEDTLLFYRLGDFYELFFEDAETASHELELTLTGKNAGLEERVPMCGVPHHAANIYIQKLVDKGYKVAICEQVEDPKTAKGIVKREVIEVVSRGTLTNTEALNEHDFNFIASITDNFINYIFSYADLLSGKVYACYLSHDKNKLISYINNLNIKEVVVNSSFDKEILFELKNNYNVFISINDNTLDGIYNNIFEGIKDNKLIENTKVVISYLINNQKKELKHFQSLEIVDTNLFMELGIETVRNLELVETIRSKDRTNSLLGFLDKTKTAMGSRLLKSYIISPLLNKDEIIRRQNIVELLIKEFLYKSELKTYLYEIYDLERLTGKIVCNNVNARDLLQLKKSLSVLPDINLILKELNLEELNTFPELVTLLEKSINEDAPLLLKEGNLIKDGYNSEIDELRNIRKNGKDFISKFEREEIERTGISTLRVGYNKVFGYYIEISKGQVKNIPEDFKYERKQTTTNSERYISPLLKEKEDLILNAEEKLNNLEYDIFNEIKEEIKKYIHELQVVSSKIAFYDVMQSYATVAEENNFVKPILNEEGIINVVDGRHPVVENVIKDEYTPNDIKMDEKTNILLITGPNMSGKSTYMRELAIIIILNQIGSYVPAKEANLPIIDKIFTRIGASDDLVGGESTFMVEMKESAIALKNATKNSLILFDELGRGTSTYDGMSLAGSIIEYIETNIKCKTLFSTHYHELTKMADTFEGIKNVHVSIYEENGNIKFLHKVKNGAVDKSYGINVAKLADLPDKVIERADELLHNYEGHQKRKKIIKQVELELIEEKENPLYDFIDNINPNEITPIEALNLIYEIKGKREDLK